MRRHVRVAGASTGGATALNAPHTPVVVPAGYLNQIGPDRIALPAPGEDELRVQPERERRLLRGFEGSQSLSPEQLRKVRQYYYARAAFADAMMGRLLDWMRSRHLLDNTIVCMTSDHGSHLGDHGLLQKQTFYEQVVTVPFLFWSRDRIRTGVRLNNAVNTSSLLPTVLDLAGLPAMNVEAPSLAACLRSGSEPRRDPVFSEIAFGYQGYRDADRQVMVMVRHGDLKLSIFLDGSDPDGALYDLRTDPGERVNRITDRQQTGHIRRFIGKWDQHRRRTDDHGGTASCTRGFLSRPVRGVRRIVFTPLQFEQIEPATQPRPEPFAQVLWLWPPHAGAGHHSAANVNP